MDYKSVKPAFEKDNIAIAFAVDQNYLPYLKYAVKSIVSNLNRGNLDILVLHGGKLDGGELLAYFSNFQNVSVRFVDASAYFNAVIAPYFVQREYFTIASVYRLMIPDLLPAYDKMLWLDADIVVTGDISELYGEDLAGFWLGAVKDFGLGDHPRKTQEIKRYKTLLQWAKKYNFNPWQKYINSGVLLMNLAALRAADVEKRLVNIAIDPLSQWPDQDALNVVCRGHIKYLDERWNFQVFTHPVRELPGPGIVHYIGRIKPWCSPRLQHADLWWNYFYQDGQNTETVKRILKVVSDSYEERLVELNAKCRKIKRTVSYKLGRALTKPFRAITGAKDL